MMEPEDLDDEIKEISELRLDELQDYCEPVPAVTRSPEEEALRKHQANLAKAQREGIDPLDQILGRLYCIRQSVKGEPMCLDTLQHVAGRGLGNQSRV
jgi:hypothetical protein